MLHRGKYIALKTFIRKQIELKVSVNKDSKRQVWPGCSTMLSGYTCTQLVVIVTAEIKKVD